MARLELGRFTWESGSINDNIRKILKSKNYNYRNTFNGDIEADISGFGIWEKIQYEIADKEKEEYVVYVA